MTITHPLTGCEVTRGAYWAITTQALIAEYEALQDSYGAIDARGPEHADPTVYAEIAPLMRAVIEALAARVDAGDPIAVSWSDDDKAKPDAVDETRMWDDTPMRTTHVVGPATGHLYEAHDTGDTWNGSPVLAFTLSDILALIKAGDGVDGNGYGLENHAGRIVDVTGPDDLIPVPTLIADVRETLVLYIPEGRAWEEAD